VVKGDAGAEVLVDGKPAATTPMKGAALLPPGKHVVHVIKNGAYAWSQEVRIEREGEVSLEAKLRTTTQRKVSYAAGALGLAAVGAGIGLTVVAVGAEVRAQRILEGKVTELEGGQTAVEAYNEAVRTRRDFVAGAAIGYGAGAVGLISAVLLYSLDKPPITLPSLQLEEPKKEKKPGATMEMGALPVFGPGHGGLQVIGRF
jgi:hypothetical protein